MGLPESAFDSESRSDQWRTPEWVYAPLEYMGGIDLDPCGHPTNLFARHTILLPEYEGQELTAAHARYEDQTVSYEDGLAANWRGLAFINGPWSHLKPWLEKSCQSGEAESVFVLPARMNAKWLHDEMEQIEGFWFPRKRIQYIGDSGKEQNPYHSGLLYIGERWALFSEVYRDLGHCLEVR